ncbi:quinate 5-dehydrogenase [Anaerosinus massiliensis]|uniref:quinate 5-dehydrogenase n=1 Tax=Massilibacillus massiliensis TaxID=1806837 RepID=UPI000A3DF6CE|nr:quinate 5-dehydrogenase [Massilibacillus massiliensis]
MKRIMSISLGSSKRNHQVSVLYGNEKFSLERIGTDGDKRKAIALIKKFDGEVDAFGLGGTDLYIYAGEKRYTFRESKEFVRAAGTTPIVDGSGLKNTLERHVIENLQKNKIIDFTNLPVLLVCGVDRFGMASALNDLNSDVVFGDLLFGLGLPIAIRDIRYLNRFAKFLAPIVTQIPIRYFYPIGKKQEESKPRFAKYFHQAKVIAGDFHFIKRYMPDQLENKIILTNTVTQTDKDLLCSRGVKMLITTTPNFDGRSFGTNMLEAMLVASKNQSCRKLTPKDYEFLLKMFDIQPHIQIF